MELVKPVEPVLWACIVELVMGGTGYGTVEALICTTLLGRNIQNCVDTVAAVIYIFG